MSTLETMTMGGRDEDSYGAGVGDVVAISGPCRQGEHGACRGFSWVRRADGPVTWVDEDPCSCDCHGGDPDQDT